MGRGIEKLESHLLSVACGMLADLRWTQSNLYLCLAVTGYRQWVQINTVV